MKFLSNSKVFGVLVAASALLFAPAPIQACEEPCRVGVSQAFADSYAAEINPIFNTLSNNISTWLYSGMAIDQVTPDSNLAATVLWNVYNSTKTQVNQLSSSFIQTIPVLAEDAIFNQTPQFKGDCNHPFRVTQPPVGVPWTMDDCVKMDYICGNPPSICNHLSIAKARIIKTIQGSIANHSAPTSEFFTTLTNNIKTVATAGGLQGPGLDYLVKQAGVNVQNFLASFPAAFTNSFCTGTTCDKYDANIKALLLKYP